MTPKNTAVVTTAIILDTRRQRKEIGSKVTQDGKPLEDQNLYPIVLRVTHLRKQKYYRLKYIPVMRGGAFTEHQKGLLNRFHGSIALTEAEFKGMTKREPLKTLSVYLNEQEKDARETAAKIVPFTFPGFETTYFSSAKNDNELFTAIQNKIDSLRKDGQISTASIYECMLNSIKKFSKKSQLPFNHVTVDFLKGYESWMTSLTIGKKAPRSISKTTISMYLRHLRAVFNEYAPDDTPYPFGKGKYLIPRWRHNKRALTQSEVAQIAQFGVVEGTLQHKSRDLWLFSYLCNGINFKDIAHLRYRNIIGDTLVFERSKTARNGNDVIAIKVIITKQIGRILDCWGNRPANPGDYIFDILQPGMTLDTQHKTIKQCVKNTNKHMRQICSDIGIPESTTYVARHSFATVLKRSGASVEFISESLGHRNIATTQNYLADFELDEKRKWAEKLLPEL